MRTPLLPDTSCSGAGNRCPIERDAARDRVVAINASADREIVPEFRTLVFIEATQYVTSDSSVWSVQVWRVTLVRAVRDRLARVPVANSI